MARSPPHTHDSQTSMVFVATKILVGDDKFELVPFVLVNLPELWQVGRTFRMESAPIVKVSFARGHRQKVVLLDTPNQYSSVEFRDDDIQRSRIKGLAGLPLRDNLIAYRGTVTSKQSHYIIDGEYRLVGGDFVFRVGSNLLFVNVQHRQRQGCMDDLVFCPLVSQIFECSGELEQQIFPLDDCNTRFLNLVRREYRDSFHEKIGHLFHRPTLSHHPFFQFFSHFDASQPQIICSCQHDSYTRIVSVDKIIKNPIESNGCTVYGQLRRNKTIGKLFLVDHDDNQRQIPVIGPLRESNLVLIENAHILESFGHCIIAFTGSVHYLDSAVEDIDDTCNFESFKLGIIEKIVEPSLVSMNLKSVDSVSLQAFLDVKIVAEVTKTSLHAAKIRPCRISTQTLSFLALPFERMNLVSGLFVAIFSQSIFQTAHVWSDDSLSKGNALLIQNGRENATFLKVSPLVLGYLFSHFKIKFCRMPLSVRSVLQQIESNVEFDPGISVKGVVRNVRIDSDDPYFATLCTLELEVTKDLFERYWIGLPKKGVLHFDLLDHEDHLNRIHVVVDVLGRKSFPFDIITGQLIECFGFKRMTMSYERKSVDVAFIVNHQPNTFISVSTSRICLLNFDPLRECKPCADNLLFAYLSEYYDQRSNRDLPHSIVMSKCRISSISAICEDYLVFSAFDGTSDGWFFLANNPDYTPLIHQIKENLFTQWLRLAYRHSVSWVHVETGMFCPRPATSAPLPRKFRHPTHRQDSILWWPYRQLYFVEHVELVSPRLESYRILAALGIHG